MSVDVFGKWVLVEFDLEFLDDARESSDSNGVGEVRRGEQWFGLLMEWWLYLSLLRMAVTFDYTLLTDQFVK